MPLARGRIRIGVIKHGAIRRENEILLDFREMRFPLPLDHPADVNEEIAFDKGIGMNPLPKP